MWIWKAEGSGYSSASPRSRPSRKSARRSCSPLRSGSGQHVCPPAPQAEQVAAAAQRHLEPSIGLLGAAGDVHPHPGDFGSQSSILVQTRRGWQLTAELGTELIQMQTQERHSPGETREVAKEGNASLRGCSRLRWSSSAGAQSQAALPHFWLLLLHFLFLNFPVTCLSCLFLVSLSSATIPLQPGCLPQGDPSLNLHHIWGRYGNRLLWQEAEFAVWSVTVVGFVQSE